MKKNNGRFYIKSLRTGKTYLIEAIGHVRTEFGDSLDEQCRGSIREKDSIISDANCRNIGYSRNPVDYINSLEP